jgi:hypothetical protein
MAQKVEVVLTCDLDDIDTPAVETVTFSFRGQGYEFELCQPHLDEFAKVMEGYARSARRNNRPGRAARAGRSPSGGGDIAAIRQWARSNGHQVSDRGRIPASVRSAYEAARG